MKLNPLYMPLTGLALASLNSLSYAGDLGTGYRTIMSKLSRKYRNYFGPISVVGLSLGNSYTPDPEGRETMTIHDNISRHQLGMAATVAIAIALTVATPAPAAALESSASVADNVLTVTGTRGADQIVLVSSGPNTLDVTFGADGVVQSFDRSTFNAIKVVLGAGNDQFSALGNLADEAVTIDAGAGNDTIFGSNGNDLIFGGAGNDLVDGRQGRDTAFLDAGRDTFKWNPGDSSDAVDGGAGSDMLEFNGSLAPENMSLSAVGPRAVFLRDIASIQMDMNDVERLDLRTLGGADTVTINDMAGTGFRVADIDLSQVFSGGGGDGQIDVVTVNGTERADRVKVTADGGRVDVRGLKAETRITGAEQANDRLQINTLGGNDDVDVDPDASTLVDVGVDLGSGQK